MEGLKEALQYITGLKAESMEPKLLEINGETYCTKDLTRYHRFPMASNLSVNTLTALVDYIKPYLEQMGQRPFSSSTKTIISRWQRKSSHLLPELLFQGLLKSRRRIRKHW